MRQLAGTLGEALERWHTSLAQAQAGELDAERAFPNIDAFLAKLDNRFVQIKQMLGAEQTGQTEGVPSRQPMHAPGRVVLVLVMSDSDAGTLPPFQTAALASIHAQLERIEQLSRELFDCAAALKTPAAKPLTDRP